MKMYPIIIVKMELLAQSVYAYRGHVKE